MVFGLFGRKVDPRTDALYAAIVAQARQTAFYARLGVPDTVAGRFDMILAHLVVFAARFPAEEAAIQRLVDRFFTDMDDSLREMGISDTGVGKRMKTLGGAYLGRSDAYRAALAVGDAEMLAAAIDRILYEGADDPTAPAALAGYFLDLHKGLARQAPADLLESRIIWPDLSETMP